MKTTKLLSAFLFAMLLVTFSCQKDDGNSGGGQQENIPDTFSEYFGNDISRDFLGNVVDSNNNPIEGVTITIGNETATTDSNGVFIIRDADVKERFGYIKAEKAGYIHGSRSVVPSNGTNKVTIMLLEAVVSGTVSSGSEETVSLDNGSSVSFDGNFVKDDGSAYTGSVDVIIHHLDPTDEDMPMQMPGMLYAENDDGAERMLQTLGMLAVELRGSGGEDLNLAEGSTSEIKIPVDASLMNIAPATIPLWYFDEVNGYWKEEGEAILQGNMYVGIVSHFSFWNCDIPTEVAILCVNLINEDGNEISNMRVTLSSDVFGTTSGISNNNGEVCGLIPINDTLTLNIFSNGICDNIMLYSQSLGTFSSDSTIEIIVPNNPEITEDTVSGNFLTCDGEIVTNGYVLLNYDGIVFSDLVDDGNFEVSLYRCYTSTEFTLEGNDIENSQSSSEVTYNFASPLTNVGDVVACENYAYDYVYFQVGNYEPVSLVGGPNPLLEEQLFRCNFITPEVVSTGYESTGIAFSNGFGAYFNNFNGLGTYTITGNETTPDVVVGMSNIFSHLEEVTFNNQYYSHGFEGTVEVLSVGGIGEVFEINILGTFDIINDNDDTGQQIIEENVPIQGYMSLIRKS